MTDKVYKGNALWPLQSSSKLPLFQVLFAFQQRIPALDHSQTTMPWRHLSVVTCKLHTPANLNVSQIFSFQKINKQFWITVKLLLFTPKIIFYCQAKIFSHLHKQHNTKTAKTGIKVTLFFFSCFAITNCYTVLRKEKTSSRERIWLDTLATHTALSGYAGWSQADVSWIPTHAQRQVCMQTKAKRCCFLSWFSVLHDYMLMQRGDRDGDVGMVWIETAKFLSSLTIHNLVSVRFFECFLQNKLWISPFFNIQ